MDCLRSTYLSPVFSNTMKRRNKYSHNGCKRCKSSSIKCDETKPGCLNCSKRGLICEYKSSVFIYQPNQISKNKKKVFKNIDTKEKTKMIQREASNIATFPPNNSFEIIDQVIHQMRLDFNTRTSKPDPRFEKKSLDCNVISGFYSESCLAVPSYVKHWKPYDQERYLYLKHKLDSKGETTEGIYYHENDPEVQEFLFYSMTASKSVYNFVLVTDDYHNCVSDWFLYFSKKYSIIGYTVNSITSNLLDILCLDDRWAWILQRTKGTTLINILQRVGKCESFTEMVCYLTCIMFLFSERSASRLDDWRLHLKGAFAIIERCDSLYAELSNNLDNIDHEMNLATRMYSWAKNWFAASETIACLSAPKGGAIGDINLSRRYLGYGPENGGDDDAQNDFLVGGFNLMKGYSQKLTPIFVEIIEYIITYKAAKGVSLSGSEGVLQSVTVNKPQVRLSNRLLDIVMQVEAESFDFSSIYDYKKRAIMKACNTCYCCAIRIFIYSVVLGKSIYGPEIQFRVQIIEEQLATIHNISMYGLCIHWPLFLAALCAPDSNRRKSFIIAIKDIANNGTYVARNTVERLEKCWKIIDCGGVLNEEDYDCITM